jgi:DNA primase
MAVEFDAFVDWAEKRFYDVIVSYPEVQINSIFKESDQEHKLWCNPLGGKNEVELGVYHCWKTDKWGTLAGLVMLVDGCSFEDAVEILGGETPLSDLQEKIEEFFTKKPEPKEAPTESKLILPEYTYPLAKLPTGNPYRQEAEKYLTQRKLSIDNLHVCVAGKYRQRVVIPYYDKRGELTYFNCRALSDSQIPKYLGPDKSLGIGKSDVIDALTLYQCGFFSAALGGKYLSQTQLSLLGPYQIIITVDNDEAGMAALTTIGDSLLGRGFQPSYAIPPRDFKDWNLLLQRFNEDVVRQYVEREKKPYTYDTHEHLQEMSL